jgi:hypothetical protein
MWRELAGLRLRLGLAAAVTAALAAGVAGCGSQGGTAGQSTATASPAATGSDREASSGQAGHDPLARSRLKVLTTLAQAQLCAVLSTAEATRILGAVPQVPRYSRAPGHLGISCRWLKRGVPAVSTDELYVGVSAIIDWDGAQQADKLLHATPVTIGGHPALKAGPRRATQWAQVDVALGGPHDPVAEYRAPAMAQALEMAQLATPHVLSMG